MNLPQHKQNQDSNEDSNEATTVVNPVAPLSHELIKLRIVSTIIACAVFSVSTCVAAYVAVSLGVNSDASLILAFWILPLLLALSLGVLGRSRRWGAVSGAVLGVAAIVTVAILCLLYSGGIDTDSTDPRGFLVLIGICSLFGAAGAQARRQVSQRLIANRSRSIIKSSAEK